MTQFTVKLMLLCFGDLHLVPRSEERALEGSFTNGWTPARSRAMPTGMETKEYLTQLEEATTIDAQADILHFLYNSKWVNSFDMIIVPAFLFFLMLAF